MAKIAQLIKKYGSLTSTQLNKATVVVEVESRVSHLSTAGDVKFLRLDDGIDSIYQSRVTAQISGNCIGAKSLPDVLPVGTRVRVTGTLYKPFRSILIQGAAHSLEISASKVEILGKSKTH